MHSIVWNGLHVFSLLLIVGCCVKHNRCYFLIGDDFLTLEEFKKFFLAFHHDVVTLLQKLAECEVTIIVEPIKEAICVCLFTVPFWACFKFNADPSLAVERKDCVFFGRSVQDCGKSAVIAVAHSGEERKNQLLFETDEQLLSRTRLYKL